MGRFSVFMTHWRSGSGSGRRHRRCTESFPIPYKYTYDRKQFVDYNCRDKLYGQAHERASFLFNSNINYVCPFSSSLVWPQWFQLTKSQLLQLHKQSRRHTGTFMQAKFIEVIFQKLPKNRGAVTGMIYHIILHKYLYSNDFWLEYLE